jgi:hypothetical protein
MNRRVKTSWTPGSLFRFTTSDGTHVYGQLLTFDNALGGNWSAAFFDPDAVNDKNIIDASLGPEQVVTALSIGGFGLKSGRWEFLGPREIAIPPELWPNAAVRARGAGWVGARFFDDGIVEALFEAYLGLQPWDQMHDPAYFDGLLFSPARRPPDSSLVFRRQR